MSKQEGSKRNSRGSRRHGGRNGSWRARFLMARRNRGDEGRGPFWWRLLASLAVLWWLAATTSDALLESWWLRDAQGMPGGPPFSGSGAIPSTWSLDYWAAHRRLELFRWGGSALGALICGGWAWRQGRLAVANARESPASLGTLWSVDEAGQPALKGLGLGGHHTGRWIPLEDKLALDRFRSAALRLCVALCALIGANLGGRVWTLWLSAWAARPLGRREPWLQTDLAFYLFQLPALDFAWRMVLLAHAMALVLALAIYLYEDSLQLGRRLWASARALRHIAVLLALTLAWKAVGALLYPFELLVRRSPSWSGPHAIDWFWRMPLNFTAALATLICAGLCLRYARRQNPRAVLGWSLAPMALSWIATGALPALRQATLSTPDIAREDAPFVQAQRDWTLLALGFSSNSDPSIPTPIPPASSTSGPGDRGQVQDRDALARSLSANDLTLWAHTTADADASALAVAPAPFHASKISDAAHAPRVAGVVGHVVTQSRFEPRSWEERHLNTASTLQWQRFALRPSAPSPGARGAWLQKEEDIRLPFLVGIDRADSPGLLLDSEISSAIATGAEIRASAQAGATDARVPARPRSRPVSFFNNSFSSSAQLAALGELHSLPHYRVLGSGPDVRATPGSGVASEPALGNNPAAGVPLDASWKKWLAAWRFGSLALARSARVGEQARLAWRLDVAQRCRSLAPFLSWPDAPRPVRDKRGHLFWLLDGYTLSAAFPLARPLDTAGAFAAPEPDFRHAPHSPSVAEASGVNVTGGNTSSASSIAGNALDAEEIAEHKAWESRRFVLSVLRREEVLARVARNLDGFNWARASVAALVEASTGHVRLFPLQPDDPILGLYRRALPELWSSEPLPDFARTALRTPPHLAALQAAAWAGAASPRPATVVDVGTTAPLYRSWQVASGFTVPSPRGLRSGVILTAAPPAPASMPSPTSTWAVALSPAANGANHRGEPSHQEWQARMSVPAQEIDWSRADALVPGGSGTSPSKWLARYSVGRLNSREPGSTSRADPDGQAPKRTEGAGLQRLDVNSMRAWQQAHELWRQAKAARIRGDSAREQKSSQQLEKILERNAATQP